MKLLRDHINRLGIYFFYDKDGIIDSYVPYLIRDLNENFDRLIVVCNGFLKEGERRKFEEFTDEILVRKNEGLDVGAYKTALEYIGWDHLKSYDEIVLLNNTIMGPVYSFAEMFVEMKKRDVDFWGITKYGKDPNAKLKFSSYDYIPEHIQSHFMAFRNSLITSMDFQKYWQTIPEIHSYDESVGIHESSFTKKFEDLGYKWDVYINTDEYDGITSYPLNFYAKELIVKKRCPIFKRRSFFQDYRYIIANTAGQSAAELYRYLKKTEIYDVDMIWDTILRNYHQEDIARCLQLNYIISSKYTDEKRLTQILKKKRIALVMHLYFPDLIEEAKEYASNMPKEADIYITTNTEAKKKLIENAFKDLNCNHLEVRLILNRGRDVSSLLVGVKDVIEDYDLACFVHDKKTAQLTPGSIGEGFAYKCFSNTLYNQEFVSNVIQAFEENPRMGILSPPAPNHGTFRGIFGQEWGPNFQLTRKLAKQLNITVPMSEDKMAIAPYGTFFWFRPKAMRSLFEGKWTYEDFPEEPNKNDGTILHAIERIYPFVVQQAGFYPGIIMSDDFAAIEYTTLTYYIKNMEVGVREQWEMEKEDIHKLYKNSTSWKISTPVRIVGEKLKKIRDKK